MCTISLNSPPILENPLFSLYMPWETAQFMHLAIYGCCGVWESLQLKTSNCLYVVNHILKQKKSGRSYQYASQGIMENLLFGGSVDRRLATCAAEASKPSKSLRASCEISPTSNPGRDASIKLDYSWQLRWRWHYSSRLNIQQVKFCSQTKMAKEQWLFSSE